MIMDESAEEGMPALGSIPNLTPGPDTVEVARRNEQDKKKTKNDILNKLCDEFSRANQAMEKNDERIIKLLEQQNYLLLKISNK
ncbi:hypothetical protein JTE90_009450 [Oedothorax gibbosus]|uniref:Uncharacterized protein n=1 Tax=Oedothorax gibbosus TaxID=931172 RepID=A0AAV6VV49_9ARAC|nr:hypothetical protein JTE90_009450 [Oedothorax gibbosus]